MDTARILQIFIVQSIILVFFVFLALKILSHGKKRLNVTFSLFYICIAIAAAINMIYALIFDETTVLILNFMVNFFVAFGLTFLLNFNYQLLKSKFEFGLQKQIVIMIVYAGLLFLMIGFVLLGGVVINETTNWKPVWSIYFFLYVMIIISVFAIIPTIYSSFKVYLGFESKDIKKRWIFYLIGIIGFFSYMYGAFYINYLNDDSIRLIFSIYGLSVFLWAYFVYYGVGRQLESK